MSENASTSPSTSNPTRWKGFEVSETVNWYVAAFSSSFMVVAPPSPDVTGGTLDRNLPVLISDVSTSPTSSSNEAVCRPQQ